MTTLVSAMTTIPISVVVTELYRTRIDIYLFMFRTEAIIPDGAEEVMLTDTDPEQEQRRQQHSACDEDEMGGQSRVQCTTH